LEGSDPVGLTQTGHPRLDPRVPPNGSVTESVQHTRDLRVRQSAGEFAQDIDHGPVGTTAMLAQTIARDADGGVLPTLPVDDEFNHCRLWEPSHDLFDGQANEALLDAQSVAE
jgi:hypothetical protein